MTLAAEAGWPTGRIDADYRARDCISEAHFLRIVGGYRSLSDAARGMPGACFDLAYDTASGERLDLYGTVPRQVRPVFVFLHGGYWRALSKEASSFMAPMLAARGIATAVPDYTLAPAVGIAEITRQCRAALAYLWHNAAELGIDRSRIVVGGSSAGGHLAGTLVSPGWQAGMGLPEAPVAGAMPVSGLFELAPLKASHIDGWMNFTAAEIDLCSPLRHPPAPAPRCTVAVAEVETAGFHRQSAAYAGALGAPLLTVPGRNHFDIILDWTDPDSAMSRTLLDLF